MSIIVNLAPGYGSKSAKIGDAAKIQIVFDEKIGVPGDQWKIANTSAKWLVSGNLILDTTTLKSVEADGSLTKIEISGIVHSPGDTNLGTLTLVHSNSLKEFNVPEANLAELKVESPQKEQKEPAWYLPAVPFGTWNYLLVTIFGVVLFAAIFFSVYKIVLMLRDKFAIKLNHKERALRALEQLQAYGKPGRTLRQEDWKKFSFELASVLRKFSDANFEFNSSDMTDREFLYELSRKEKAREQIEILRNTLSTIDEVRYGKKDLDVSIVPSLIVNSRQYIESTFIDHGKTEAKK